MRFAEVLDLIIGEILAGNIDCFYLDGQTVVLEDYFELYPKKKQLIRELINRNKVIIGPWYSLADEFLVSGESMFRNMLLGIKQSKELGCNKFIGYLPDSFGHSSEIPRILSAFGIKNAVLWRGAGSQKSEFIWKSQDDSSVLATYLIEGYFQDILQGNIFIEEKAAKLKEFLDKIKEFSTTDYILLPVGADHLGPVLGFKDMIKKIEDLLDDYSFESGGIFEYVGKINSISPQLSVFQGELRDNSRNPILPGTLSTRIYLKQANSVSTWKLSKLAEPFYAFLQNKKLVPPKNNELEYAWKLLLKNHAHDSICGCSIDAVHREMLPRFEQINQISDWLITKGKIAVSKLIEENSIWVYNASDYEFSGVVKVKTATETSLGSRNKEFPEEILMDTQRVPVSEDMENFSEILTYVEKIPPHSIAVIDKIHCHSELDSESNQQTDYFLKYPNGQTLKQVQGDKKVEISENFIKNSRISLEISADGSLKFTDYELDKEFDGLHEFCDRVDNGDTYNFAPLENDKSFKSKLIKTEIIEKNDLKSTLRLYYLIKDCEIITDATVFAGSRRVEFNTNWENNSKDHILQIKFSLKEKIRETFSENTFGLIKRKFDPDYNLQEHIPAEKGRELRTNTAPMQRFVWAQGLGVITEGLSEYEVEKENLYVTILRSVGMLSKLSLNTRNFPAGPPLETPEAQCLGRQTARYAICASEAPEDLFKEADEFFGSVITGVGTGLKTETLSFLSFNNKNIYTYAVKLAEKGEGIILRLMNLSSEVQKISINENFAAEVNGLEEILFETREFEFKPYELKNILLI